MREFAHSDGSSMDPIALDTFLAVAQQGSVTAAASRLHTVQSNVTARLHQLEADLGTPLFVRHSRGVKLTPAGSKLLSYAERLRALAAEAKAAVRDDGVARGVLRIGTMETTAVLRLPALLGQLHRMHRDVQIEVRTGPTAELLELVLAHRLDGAFVAGPIQHPRLDARTMYREELVLVSARDGAAMAQRLAAGELTAITFREGCSYRQRLETLFTARGWLPFRRLEFGTVEGILGCVADDVGVAVLPRAVVECSRVSDALRVEPLAPEPLEVDTLFVRRVDTYLGTTMRALDEVLDTVTPPGGAK
jgi:LysR family transcriptional regulator, cell division regulator